MRVYAWRFYGVISFDVDNWNGPGEFDHCVPFAVVDNGEIVWGSVQAEIDLREKLLRELDEHPAPKLEVIAGATRMPIDEYKHIREFAPLYRAQIVELMRLKVELTVAAYKP